MITRKEFKGIYKKQVEVFYRRPIKRTSDLGGVHVIVGVSGLVASEGRNFIKLKDISDIVRDEQNFGAGDHQAEERIPPSVVYINKKDIGELYVKE